MSADMDFILGSEKLKTYFQYHWNLMPDIKPDIHAVLFQNLYKMTILTIQSSCGVKVSAENHVVFCLRL